MSDEKKVYVPQIDPKTGYNLDKIAVIVKTILAEDPFVDPNMARIMALRRMYGLAKPPRKE